MTFGRYDYACFLTFFAYAAGSLIVPVALVGLARELGFTLEEGGMTAGGGLHLGRTVAIIAALILVGFMTGRWGHRKTLGMSVLLMATGMAVCSLAPVYGVLLLALVMAGLGEGVIEGLATPYVHELHPDEPGRYINFSHSFWSIGVLCTVVVSGVLLTLGVSWRMLILGVSALGFVAALMLLAPTSAGSQAEPAHVSKTPRDVGRDGMKVLRAPGRAISCIRTG